MDPSVKSERKKDISGENTVNNVFKRLKIDDGGSKINVTIVRKHKTSRCQKNENSFYGALRPSLVKKKHKDKTENCSRSNKSPNQRHNSQIKIRLPKLIFSSEKTFDHFLKTEDVCSFASLIKDGLCKKEKSRTELLADSEWRTPTGRASKRLLDSELKSCAKQALRKQSYANTDVNIDSNVDELTAYFDELYLPRKMSFMAEMMYT